MCVHLTVWYLLLLTNTTYQYLYSGQQIVSLADSGDITKAEQLLNQMQEDAILHNQKETLPDIDSYTALMDAYIEEQNRLISAIEVETDEIKSDVNATMPNVHCAESNERGTLSIISLAEKANDLLIHKSLSRYYTLCLSLPSICLTGSSNIFAL